VIIVAPLPNARLVRLVRKDLLSPTWACAEAHKGRQNQPP